MEPHDCYENKEVVCDGDTHTHICRICGTFLGETRCTEKER